MIINFGDVFTHREKEYIFLAKTEEIIYAAQILTIEESKNVNRLSEIRARSFDAEKYKNHSLYCIVTLRTEDFKNRIAFLGKTEKYDLGYIFNKLDYILDVQDKIEIKNEILRLGSPVPLILKELVKNLDI